MRDVCAAASVCAEGGERMHTGTDARGETLVESSIRDGGSAAHTHTASGRLQRPHRERICTATARAQEPHTEQAGRRRRSEKKKKQNKNSMQNNGFKGNPFSFKACAYWYVWL